MKRYFAMLLALSLLILPACADTASSNSSVPSTESESAKEYPGNTNIPFDNVRTILPNEIYSTPAKENKLDGTIYVIEGIVTKEAEKAGATYFVIETSGGNVAVCDALDYDMGEVDIVDVESLREYFPLPSVGENVAITAEYIGFSNSLDLAMFVYGGSEYLSKAVICAEFDSFLDSLDSSDPTETMPEISNVGTTDNQGSVTQPIVTPSATTAPIVSSVTTGEKNALSSANNYLRFSAFSYEGLVEQLEFEGYTNAEATYAADNCGADWNAQAVKSAKNYLSFSAFSYSGLVSQLEFEGFTIAQASHGVDNCGADWYEQAAKSAANCIELMPFSRTELISQLEFEGFTHEQAVYGADSVGL